MEIYMTFVTFSIVVLFEVFYSVIGSSDCPPLPNDCQPDCIVNVAHCRKCDCDAASAYGMTFGGQGGGGNGGSGSGSPFNQGNDLSKTPFTSSIDAMGASMGGGGLGEMSGIGNGGMRNGLMSVPGMFLHGPSTTGRRTCLRGEMICPSYCLVIDEYGCKSCPCGPANGMAGTMISHSKSKENSDNKCLATLLCMLSCKDGYKIGPKGKDGCNTCECTKKKDEEKQNGKDNKDKGTGDKGGGEGTDQAGSGNNGSGSGDGSSGFNPMIASTSMGGGGMGGMTGSGSGCSGPFCAGGKSSKGPFSMSGGNKDHCIGPACSAPGNHNPGGPQLNVPASCKTTDLCVKTCKFSAKLGPKMADGCPSCACVKNEAPTTATPKQELCDKVVKCMMSCTNGYRLKSGHGSECPICECTKPATQPHSNVQVTSSKTNVLGCTERTVQCMKSCKNGYHMQSAAGETCPRCSCLPPPTESPVKGIYSVLQQCPETVHCMTSCSNGYSLDGGSSRCPQCTCHTGAVTTLTCTGPFSCPQGCQLGYRCGQDGCPSCSCIEGKEIGMIHTNTYIKAPMTCSSQFNCPSRCDLGYSTGENGCPTCKCIERVTEPIIQPPRVTNINLALTCPETIECIKSCRYGYKTSQGLTGCPECTCSAPVTMVTQAPIVVVNPVKATLTCTGPECQGSTSVHTVSIKDRCPETFRCNELCEHGFSLRTKPGKTCPICECASPETALVLVKPQKPPVNVVPVKTTIQQTENKPIKMQGSQVNTESEAAGFGPVGNAQLHPGIPNLAANIPHVSHVSSLHESLTGDQTHTGGVNENCIGPECSAKNGLRNRNHQNQCTDIMKCVVSCSHGYKLGSKGEDGCPKCRCL